MSQETTDIELELYLDEQLPEEEMAALEEDLRNDSELAKRLSVVNGRRSAGLHSLGEIWRRNRISCASREDLGSYLLGTLDSEATDYLKFHLETVGCRFCNANLGDLRNRQAEEDDAIVVRRRKYFQSSAGYLDEGEK